VATVYTIGHSTRSPEDLLETLRAHDIAVLMDIRSFPMSRRLPHFNREVLEESLPDAGIEYLWEPRLGGRRPKLRDDSPNTALRNQSFRNYADYMLTDEFRKGANHLLETAKDRKVAIMCAERVYFHCHRMLVSDWLALHGHEVFHIESVGADPRPHKPMAEAQLVDNNVIYNGGQLF
jgi:uncharacterized protein (DUF488 family)